jgi:hypothetical protein
MPSSAQARQSFLLSFAEVLAYQYHQSRPVKKVPRLLLTPTRFFREYYFLNRPVVIRGLMSGWKALQLWSPEYFAERFGKYTVEISAGRDADPLYYHAFDAHRTKLKMAEFARNVVTAGETNDFYLHQGNRLLRRKPFRPLFAHFRCPKGFVNPKSFKRGMGFWFGPKGTIAKIHHDGINALLGQIYGRKHVKLLSPFDVSHMYDAKCLASVDLEDIDYKRFPLMKHVPILDVIVQPGEFLFIPIGWWHWVKALDVSISLSLRNFCIDSAPPKWRWRTSM